jgi:catechol 2,3-dioxygenase-like lactoylglutathione lyase family enzyme
MAFHHVALATRDAAATHDFYTDVMGFTLVKAVAAGTNDHGGWAKHFFYDTGGNGLIAFWELHDDDIAETWSPAISTGLGLPEWVNHIAFDAPDVDALEARKQHWLGAGLFVVEIDHGWCASIYTTDPNGILVEFCTTTLSFTDADRGDAHRVLADTQPALEASPVPRFHAGRARADTPQ